RSSIGEKIKAKGIDLIETDALSLALECGSQKAVNVVLIGLLASISSDFTKEEWLEALKSTVPAKLLDINLKAFEAGYTLKR
ncbi:MAG: 2-oxoacid:acceptor oxidoreductase family protein, partial [Clostridiales bacterium]|nr:2-oxoacid:acceptor oxidoreductase family protein [Clostridiales bacterium]